MNKINIPRLCIVGTNSDAGKTTIAIGLMSYFRRSGLRVQPFKIGYDFLDAYYHSVAAGRPSMNLHSWMIEPTTIPQAFQFVSAGADLSIVEGGGGVVQARNQPPPVQEQSKVLRELNIPTVLVIDSVKWLELRKHLNIREDIRIDAVILNRSSDRHSVHSMKKEVMDMFSPGHVWEIPKDSALSSLPNRYFGHVPYDSDPYLSEQIERTADRLATHIDMKALLTLAQSASPLEPAPIPLVRSSASRRIAVAQDLAFHMPEVPNIRLLESFGAEVVPFSPLSDCELPSNIHGLYLSGRSTELFAADLARNTSMFNSISSAIQDGLITFAEGGGFMVLTEAIIDFDGVPHSMAGLIPGATRMVQPRVCGSLTQLLGTRDTVLMKAGESLEGFEDHLGAWDMPSRGERTAAFTYSRKYRDEKGEEGWILRNAMATTVHTNLLSNTNVAKRWAG